MKRIILLVLLSMSFQFSYGQISFGLRAGGNLSDQKFKDAVYGDYGKAIGLYGGVFAETGPLSKKFIRVEFNYTQKGVRQNSSEPSYNVRFNYLTFNFLYGYRLLKNLAVLVGPEIGYLTHVNADSGYEHFFGQNNYNKGDLAADLGIAYHIFKQLSLEARYSYGLRILLNQDYVDDINAGAPTGIRVTNGANQVLSVGLNYKFLK